MSDGLTRRRVSKPARSWAHGPVADNKANPQEEESTKSICREIWENRPDKLECKHTVFLGYGFFAFCLIWTMCQAVYDLFEVPVSFVYEKLTKDTILGGTGADFLYVEYGMEYAGGVELEVFDWRQAQNMQLGEGVKECRLACVNNPDCVFFSVNEYNYATDQMRAFCYLKGWNVNERIATPNMNSGALLNRLPPSVREEFLPVGNFVFAHQDSLDDLSKHNSAEHVAKHADGAHAFDPETTELANTAALGNIEDAADRDGMKPNVEEGDSQAQYSSLDSVWVEETFPFLKGPMRRYVSNFMSVELEVAAIITCVQECLNLGCTHMVYKRTTQTCYLPGALAMKIQGLPADAKPINI